MKLSIAGLWVLLFSFLFGLPNRAATLPPNFSEQAIGGTWNEAVGLLFEDNGRMYVWERGGRVWIVENGVKSSTPLIDISEEVGGWRDFGLLGFVLDPNFRQNGHIYLLYVVDRHHLMNFGTAAYNPASNQYFAATIGRVTRYTARSSDGFRSVDMTSRRVLLGETKETGIPILHESHGVGSLAFGTDGTLLVSCGDGASYSSTDIGSAAETYFSQGLADGIIKPKENIGAYRSQLVDSHNGKILRIDPASGDGIPSNPFYVAANPRSARSRVWSVGLRNPCRMTVKPGTGSHNRADANPGTLLIGDVGWGTWEDLHIATGPGQNFGWPAFEGLTVHSGYYNSNVQNLDAPNPLYPATGCSQYFYFRDLVKQDTQVAANRPPFNNPCNASMKIPSSIPQFLHSRPVVDWRHGANEARVPIFNADGSAGTSTLGTAGCPVLGASFPGNCSIGGTWYSGSDFPAQYRNTFFSADYGAQWIKNFVFDSNGVLTEVRPFASNAGGVVAVATDPLNGALYYISWTSALLKVTYSATGNLPPRAIASSDVQFGPGPLSVQFSSAGSSDPENLPLSFAWNFGDGSPINTSANPSHVFNAVPGVPTKFTVTLTVTDSAGQTATADVIISANNTPPAVTITSPVGDSRYPMTGDTAYNLSANVVDAEFSDSELLYEWQTILRHNNHEHPEPTDNNHVTTTVISPAGCDGNTYFYRILLKVTDPAGLSTQSEVRLYPDCPNLPPVASFTATPSTGIAPLLVSFDGRASGDPDGDPITFAWTFGDGGTDTSLTPSHTYTSPGTYTATLTVSDNGALSHSTSRTITVSPPSQPLPSPWQHQDIGTVGSAGDATYSSGTFTVSGSGADIWNNADGFQYMYQPWTGNGEIVARVGTVGNTDPWAKAGVMFRETLAAGSPHAMMVITPGNGAAFQYRTALNGVSTHVAGPAVTAPYWVRLVRNGNSFTGFASPDGVTWTQVGSVNLTTAAGIYVGLPVTAHNNAAVCTATFSGVAVTVPVIPPTITLTSPANGATFTAPANINLAATVTANGNTITRVEFLRNGTVIGQDTTSPYAFTWSSVAAGSYSLVARVVYNGGSTVNSAAANITVTAPPAFATKINFQPSGRPVPSGYLADVGSTYGNRGNGYTYGWNASNTSWTRDRNSSRSPDQRYDTLNHMQKSSANRWEIAVPNGSYQVFVVAGDASNTDSVYRVNVEGLLTVSGTPTSSTRWFSGTRTVTVSDGRLTISNGSGASNNKICFVDIASAGSSLAAASLHGSLRLELLSLDPDGTILLAVPNRAGRQVRIVESSDLLNWAPSPATLLDEGSVWSVKPATGDSSNRFYRAELD